MATRKPKAKKPPIQNPTILRTVALSQDDELALAQLSQEVADRIGRAPSRSAVFRALLSAGACKHHTAPIIAVRSLTAQ